MRVKNDVYALRNANSIKKKPGMYNQLILTNRHISKIMFHEFNNKNE